MPMDQQILRDFDTHCVQDEPPACQTTCPLHLEARNLAGLMAAGKLKDARKIIDRYMPLSGLSAYLCEGPCQNHCRRVEMDQAVDLPLLERFCVSQTSMIKPMPMPKTGKNVAAVGAGLSGLTLAWELGKKGHAVTLFHVGPAGGRLRGLPPERLPEKVLAETLETLGKLRVTFTEVPAFSPDLLAGIRRDFLCVYLGFDDPALCPEMLGVTPAEVMADPVTLVTGLDKVCAYPLNGGRTRFIDDLAFGKKAAGSMNRLFQGVEVGAAREAEEVYPTRLYTNLANIPVRVKNDPADPLAPTAGEIQAEAGRCIPCQCLECVRQCPYLKEYNTYPKKAAREIFNTISTAVGNRYANYLALSCAECGLCLEICPQGADMAYFTREARKEMVAGKHMPISAHEFAMEDMAAVNSPDLAFARHQPGHSQSRWLFFPGCQLPASRPGATEAVYDHLAGHLQGGVGLALACCGAPASWAARPLLTDKMVAVVRDLWLSVGRPTVILACPSCALFFEASMPEIPVETLWNMLAGLPTPPGAAAGEILALHDPCAARHDQKTQSSVRLLAKMASQTVEEPPWNGQSTRCCGYGGLLASANPELADKFAKERLEDTGRPLLTYCVMCRDRMRAQNRPALHMLDILFPENPPAETARRKAPGLSDRQENRREFRRAILLRKWEEPLPEDLAMADITIHIAQEPAEKMEKRRILRDDVRKALLAAKERGPLFSHPVTGRHLAGYRPRQVTYWVEYTARDDGSFDVHDAYCHRMVVPGVPGEGADSVSIAEGYNPEGGRA